jgi:hypothetical protein
MRQRQFQQWFKPTPKPGGEAETIYNDAWDRGQSRPDRNARSRQIASVALVAMAPTVFAPTFVPPFMDFNVCPQPYSRTLPRTYAQAPSFFFQPQTDVSDFTWPALSQPVMRHRSRLHSAPAFFFDPRSALFALAPPPPVDQPLPRRASQVHGLPSFFFEQEIRFSDQPFADVSQPHLRVLSRRHCSPAFFFQETVAAAEFTGQPEGLISQPLARRLRRPDEARWFFLEEAPVFQPVRFLRERTFRWRERLRLLPSLFAPVAAPGEEAETIYEAWYQQTSEPARNQRADARHRVWLASVGTQSTFQEDLAATAFTTYGVITRNLGGVGMTVYFEATLKTSNATYPAQARVYNITDVGVLPLSQISTSSLTPARVRSLALTLPALPKEYRVEFGGQTGVGATYTIYSADLIFGA